MACVVKRNFDGPSILIVCDRHCRSSGSSVCRIGTFDGIPGGCSAGIASIAFQARFPRKQEADFGFPAIGIVTADFCIRLGSVMSQMRSSNRPPGLIVEVNRSVDRSVIHPGAGLCNPAGIVVKPPRMCNGPVLVMGLHACNCTVWTKGRHSVVPNRMPVLAIGIPGGKLRLERADGAMNSPFRKVAHSAPPLFRFRLNYDSASRCHGHLRPPRQCTCLRRM